MKLEDLTKSHLELELKDALVASEKEANGYWLGYDVYQVVCNLITRTEDYCANVVRRELTYSTDKLSKAPFLVNFLWCGYFLFSVEIKRCVMKKTESHYKYGYKSLTVYMVEGCKTLREAIDSCEKCAARALDDGRTAEIQLSTLISLAFKEKIITSLSDFDKLVNIYNQKQKLGLL